MHDPVISPSNSHSTNSSQKDPTGSTEPSLLQRSTSRQKTLQHWDRIQIRTKQLGRFLHLLWRFFVGLAEGLTKIAAAIAVGWIVVSLVDKNSALHAWYAQRTGVEGIVRYEVGALNTKIHSGEDSGLRPTAENGQLALQRSGSRMPTDLEPGDILLAMSTNTLRVAGSCGYQTKTPNCGDANRIMYVQTGKCLSVLETPLHEDPEAKNPQIDIHYSKIHAAWVRVATSPCSPFKHNN